MPRVDAAATAATAITIATRAVVAGFTRTRPMRAPAAIHTSRAVNQNVIPSLSPSSDEPSADDREALHGYAGCRPRAARSSEGLVESEHRDTGAAVVEDAQAGHQHAGEGFGFPLVLIVAPVVDDLLMRALGQH